MKDLLPYYERELSFLRQHSQAFAECYPKIAARLQMSGEGCDDPHVERMIESCALLSARVTKRLEDGYPEFSESLLNVLYPHYLRPFPSCAIAHFDADERELQLASVVSIERGTELQSRPVRGAPCTFRTAWRVNIVPVRVARLGFSPIAQAPSGVQLAAEASAMLSLSLELKLEGAQAWINSGATLRLFIDAEPSVAAALRDALFLAVIGAHVENGGGWYAIDHALIEPVGFAADEALIDFPDNAHDAYRHLTEYFAFPEKYDFFDLALGRLPLNLSQSRKLTVHFSLKGIHPGSDGARLLSTLGARNLRLGCVPVVNLFVKRGEPIRVTERKSSYPVVADGGRAFAHEVYSIDAVRRVRHSGQGESVTEFRPFFSLHHGPTPARAGNYWIGARDELVAARSPGYETTISIVGADFDPFGPKTDVLSVMLTCTNRELPTQLATGLPGGDLAIDGGIFGGAIRLVRKPTAPCRFDHRQEGVWRLISHLSLNQLSISGGGLEAFREILGLYDLAQSACSRRQIEGVKGIEQAPKSVWLKGRTGGQSGDQRVAQSGGQPFASFVRGTEVRITIDEEAFAGSGLDVFARVIDRFLGLYVHINSFVELVLLSSRSGEELIRCKPHSGASILG